MPAEHISCLQGLDVRSPEQGITSLWELSSHLQHLPLQTPESTWLMVQTRARQRGWRCPAWAGPGVQGQGVCLFADNGFSAPFSYLCQQRWPGRVFTSVSLLSAAQCQEFTPRLDDMFTEALSLQQLKLNQSHSTCSDLGVYVPLAFPLLSSLSLRQPIMEQLSCLKDRANRRLCCFSLPC